MGKIQDIHALEQCIYDIVQDYIDDCYNVDDVLAISKKGNKIVVTADARERIVRNSTTEIYFLKNLLRTGDDGEQEPDNDTISDIANSWLFLDLKKATREGGFLFSKKTSEDVCENILLTIY